MLLRPPILCAIPHAPGQSSARCGGAWMIEGARMNVWSTANVLWRCPTRPSWGQGDKALITLQRRGCICAPARMTQSVGMVRV